MNGKNYSVDNVVNSCSSVLVDFFKYEPFGVSSHTLPSWRHRKVLPKTKPSAFWQQGLITSWRSRQRIRNRWTPCYTDVRVLLAKRNEWREKKMEIISASNIKIINGLMFLISADADTHTHTRILNYRHLDNHVFYILRITNL